MMDNNMNNDNPNYDDRPVRPEPPKRPKNPRIKSNINDNNDSANVQPTNQTQTYEAPAKRDPSAPPSAPDNKTKRTSGGKKNNRGKKKNNTVAVVIAVVLVLCVAVTVIIAASGRNSKINKKIDEYMESSSAALTETTEPPAPEKIQRTVSFAAVGDNIIYQAGFTDAKNRAVDGGRDYNFAPLYTDIKPSPKCWVYPDSHGYESMTEAIKDSCNVYFYTMGARIASGKSEVYDSEYGTDMLRSYAERLGLATKSGVEIEESEPRASDTSAISSAIGQGTASYSCINISRYVTTIVTDGVCYNSNLILKVADRDGNLAYESKPVVANEMSDISQDTWDTVKTGMRMATFTYPALNSIKDYGIACKTGTSQPSVYEPDNATYVSYAPYSDPEITLSVEIPFGYSSLYNTEIAGEFYKYYFDEYKTSKDKEDAQDTDRSEE